MNDEYGFRVTAYDVERSPHIDLDFKPIYSLIPEQYDQIVNSLFNLVADILALLEERSDAVSVPKLAEQARDIFADYDDDLADILARYLIASSRRDDAPSPTPTGDDICPD